MVYVYEELMLVCREMESGITETQAYEHFGQRCRLTQYRKCSALLSQNLKKELPDFWTHCRRSRSMPLRNVKEMQEAGEKQGRNCFFP